jgi:translation initiation factor 5B
MRSRDTVIRQPIIVVLGHVDHGKTTLLDRIRNTAMAAKEAGGITQHIGASEVPMSAVESICGPMLRRMNAKLAIPGLLFIDTPGHEAFTNLRRRGGSVADIAVLVVDIAKGFEPQTVEAIEILKEYKTPFIVAANKVDLVTGWRNTQLKSFVEALTQQQDYVASEVESKLFELVGRLSELGFSSERFDRIKDFTKEIAIVPLSAKTGEGIAELLMLVTGLAQRFMEAELDAEASGPGRGSILEKKEITGLGTTIDVIVYGGTLHVNDTIAFATPRAVATAKIRTLLRPKPMREMRESSGSGFAAVDMVSAACGVRISGNGLEEAMPGSLVIQVTDRDYRSEIEEEMHDVFGVDEYGVVLKADSIGSIEAISKLLESGGYKTGKKGIGVVTRRDVVDAFTLNGAHLEYAAVLAFGVAVEDDAKEAARLSNVSIIEGGIIYKLIDDYKALVESRQRERSQLIESSIVFPGQIEVMPNTCFRVSHPAIFGVTVMRGRIRQGYALVNDAGVVIGRIKGIQNEKVPVETAKRGDSVAVSMDEPTFGRQVREGQILYTRVAGTDERLLRGEYSGLISQEELALLDEIHEVVARGKEK